MFDTIQDSKIGNRTFLHNGYPIFKSWLYNAHNRQYNAFQQIQDLKVDF